MSSDATEGNYCPLYCPHCNEPLDDIWADTRRLHREVSNHRADVKATVQWLVSFLLLQENHEVRIPFDVIVKAGVEKYTLERYTDHKTNEEVYKVR
jgi:hypothetical protein